MKKIGFYLALLTGLFFLSCEKHNEELGDTPDKISIGAVNNMFIKQYYTTLDGSYFSPEDLNIDLDSDGNDDIKLTSEIWGSPTVGHIPKSSIQCLSDNVQIAGFFKIDTSFLHKEIDTTVGPNNIVINDSLFYTCHQIDPSDSIIKIKYDVFKISPKDKNDVLTRSDDFKSDNITLLFDTYFYDSYFEISPDTVMFVYNIFLNDCYTFPRDEIKYIGIKITKNETEKLGWIKLGLFDTSRILIVESAIQH